MITEIDDLVVQLEQQLITWRRQFHQQPEVGFLEFRTTSSIIEVLKNFRCELFIGEQAMDPTKRLGVPSDQVLQDALHHAQIAPELKEQLAGGLTGCVAVFNTGKEGPHTVLRFDIDALPIKESDSQAHFPTQQGFAADSANMHACGHDGHITIGLGVAQLIDKKLEVLTGTITLIFQAAEEGGRGAEAFVAKGWLDNADYFLSGHIGIVEEPVGTVALTTDEFLATTKIDLTFTGKSVHAGKNPEQGRNALLSAASAALHLNGISRHSEGATRINIGTLHAGSGRNIVADYATMQIETRGMTSELNTYMEDEANRIVKASAALFDTQVDIQKNGAASSAICDPEWISWGKEALANCQFVTSIEDVKPLGASEDATAYINAIQEKGGKATFFIFASPLTEPHHNERFDYDESVLAVAVATFMRAVCYHHAIR